MNPGQEKFLNFILERVDEKDKEDVKQFMFENFKKQMEGTFGLSEIEETKNFLVSRIQPEFAEEVRQVMQQFAGNYS